jgi:glycine/D-amino acid oxidase-like deaminating enzyme
MPHSKTHSPWIEQLERTRSANVLRKNIRTDVAVVGAGIAGVTTAYFLLKRTEKEVVLIEGGRVAHGATGHNAGQLVSYFERPFHDIVKEFGIEMAGEGQKGVESSWKLLEEIRNDLGLSTPCLTFAGYAGFVDVPELLIHLKNNEARKKAGLEAEKISVAKGAKGLASIPRRYRSLYSVLPQKKILELLQTKDARYVAVISGKKGCMNSARFSEEIVSKLLQRYPDRFTLLEETHIHTVKLFKGKVELWSGKHHLTAAKTILCTNGFEHFEIQNHAGADINANFHHLVRGSVGYMAAFTEKSSALPSAISYLASHKDATDAFNSDPYFYVTRRPSAQKGENLICVGGPESLMDDTNEYSKSHPYPAEAKRMIDTFLQKTYISHEKKLHYSHFWHGLMGYTPNGIRLIGTEPHNPALLYNLGCNGVGILPSIYGSYRISQIVKGEKLAPSIFDPGVRSSRMFMAHTLTYAASFFLFLSAGLHLIAAQERFMRAGETVGAFFVLLSVLQFSLSFGCLVSRKTVWLTLTVLTALALFMLFLVSQELAGSLTLFVFEPYSLATILRKMCEILAGLTAFCALFASRKRRR